MKELYDVVLYLILKPIVYKTYIINLNIYFFINEFLEMTNEVLNPSFIILLADLYIKAISLNNKYGFSIPIF